MQAKIDVADRQEAELIRKGLADPATRALVKIMGAVAGRSRREQIRILQFAEDHFDEARAQT